MFVGVLTPKSWAEYQTFFTDRELTAPPPPKRVVFVRDDETQALVAGVCLYPTDGPYLFLEHFSYSPKLSAKDGLKAIRFLCAVVKGVAAVEAKTPLILTAVKGIADAIMAEGFQHSPVSVYYAVPGASNKSGPPADHDEEPLSDTEEVPTVPQGTPDSNPPEDDGFDEGYEAGMAAAREQQEAPAPKRRRKQKERPRPGRNPPRQSEQAPMSDFED